MFSYYRQLTVLSNCLLNLSDASETEAEYFIHILHNTIYRSPYAYGFFPLKSEFYSPVITVKAMSNRSLNLFALFLSRFSHISG